MIRPYKTSDKEQLIEVFNLNIPKFFDPKEVLDFKEYLQNHSDTYLTIEYDNKIVGGTGYHIKETDKSGRITWVFFHPNYAGRGLGKKSIDYCLEILKTNQLIEKIVVTTSQLAYAFFEKFGFQLMSIEKNYWGQGLDLYVMEQQLNQDTTTT
ncbi:GNAT family N-acetyltransferase [Aquimarina sp. AU474]|uniref:GNAT family N-acetyltransferase n=1 Tax=Aquimarina sp. AU474 TaxID=2108529 RepID=UPI000D69A6D0|nr:GNAT family N-acetyltransferase [Aquimarina sp. AU474]